MADLRTPLAKVRGLGAAKDGTEHWWRQRVTAVINIPLILWLLFSVIAMTGDDYDTVVAWVQNPVTTALLVLAIANLFYHMRLGLQVVVEDYIHKEGTKIGLLIALTFVTVLFALIAILSVLNVAFRG